eukprot:TRINITY_DN5946_c0_g1_i2.p1 TRINITY_DN5946_c0_g1~~TRINITY_DN5946_c0_g1_i2.p1  ORF type:complete len:191 (-),score=59.10 TRINITY_DN5946_c0_g1_i2:219-716(-)
MSRRVPPESLSPLAKTLSLSMRAKMHQAASSTMAISSYSSSTTPQSPERTKKHTEFTQEELDSETQGHMHVAEVFGKLSLAFDDARRLMVQQSEENETLKTRLVEIERKYEFELATRLELEKLLAAQQKELESLKQKFGEEQRIRSDLEEVRLRARAVLSSYHKE